MLQDRTLCPSRTEPSPGVTDACPATVIDVEILSTSWRFINERVQSNIIDVTQKALSSLSLQIELIVTSSSLSWSRLPHPTRENQSVGRENQRL